MALKLQPAAAEELALADALERIAQRARAFDEGPRFPGENFDDLAAAGITRLAGDRDRCELALEIALVRAVAGVDASTARILDGHFNGVERIALGAPEELRRRELEEVKDGEILVGVWGADPVGSEGPPARLEQGPDGAQVLQGVKTFCSGAGGVNRALVIARRQDGERRLAYIDASRNLRIDRDWYRASGLRSSESHRVEFHGTPVIATLGGPEELTREPYFSRDAVRTAATWAGLADCIVQASTLALDSSKADELRLHSLGRMQVAQGSVDRWLSHAAERLQSAGERAAGAERTTFDARERDPRTLAGECRVAIADAARSIAAEAARACGSRALSAGGTLDRARRDLDLFLLQHRLDPKLVELGRDALERAQR